MHIGIVGPISTNDICQHLVGDAASLPKGYSGAPLMGTLIEDLLQRGHVVSAFTLSNDMPLNEDAIALARGVYNLLLSNAT